MFISVNPHVFTYWNSLPSPSYIHNDTVTNNRILLRHIQLGISSSSSLIHNKAIVSHLFGLIIVTKIISSCVEPLHHMENQIAIVNVPLQICIRYIQIRNIVVLQHNIIDGL